MTGAKHIFIAGITKSGDVHLSFARNAIGMQNIVRARDSRCTIGMYVTLNDALIAFRDTPGVDVLVAIDTEYAASPEFMVDMVPGRDFEVCACPKQAIHWDRVKRKIASTTEDLHLTGIEYDVDMRGAEYINGRRSAIVKRSGLRILKITRQVLDSIARRHPDVGNALHAPDATRDADTRFCELWGGPIYVSLEHQTSTYTTVSYGPGCLLWRSKAVDPVEQKISTCEQEHEPVQTAIEQQ